MLEQIFGQRKSINLPVICETEYIGVDALFDDETYEVDNEVFGDNRDELLIEDISAGENEENNQSAGPSNERRGLNYEMSQASNKNSIDKFKLSMRKPSNAERNKRPANSSIQYLSMIQEKRNELEEKKIRTSNCYR